MIPKLFAGSATTFTSNGITPLTDVISCKVTEERNGVFELEMVVATTTPYFDQLEVGCLVLAKPNHTQSAQAFEIYEITKPIDQKVTVRANHISYRTSFIPISPFIAVGITATLQGLNTDNPLETNPFTIATNITNEESTYNQTVIGSLRSRLGGTDGSLLDVFGGEYEWDNFTINLKSARGADNGVQLRLGKNITELEQQLNMDRVVTGCIGYWMSGDGTESYYGTTQYSADVGNYAYARTVLLDLSDEFETAPTSAQMDSAAAEFLQQASLATPSNNVTVSFVDLADTTEYSNSPLERVNLCDTVEVIYPALELSYKAKCIKVEFDVLAERTLSVEIGDAKSTMSKTIDDLIGDSSTVITIGKKLISVNRMINYEDGRITSTIGSVQDLETTVETHSTQIEQNTEAISQRVTSSELSDALGEYVTETQLSSELQQTADSLTATFTSIVTGEVENQLSTFVTVDANGVTIGKSDSNIKGVFGNTSLDFVDEQGNKLAWLDASEGLGATQLSIGDANSSANRWRIFTSSDGSHLRFTRHN